MRKQNFFVVVVAVVFFLFSALPAQAVNRIQPKTPDREIIRETIKERLFFRLEKMCQRQIEIHNRFPRHFRVPRMCKTKEEIKPPTLEFYAEPETITEGENTSLQWASDNTLSCIASGGWQGEKDLSGEEIVSPLETTEYVITCEGVDEGIERSVVIEVLPPEPDPEPEPEPSPTMDHLIISEVYYDVDSEHGVETSNEWVEIYNGTGVDVDISGWFLEDNMSEDLIPEGTILPNGKFVVLTASSTTSGFWNNVSVVNIENSIGNGLSNTGDVVYLKNPSGEIVDFVSYGTNVTVFDPSAPDVAEGHSLARKSLDTDTNTSDDWEDKEIPTPGSF